MPHLSIITPCFNAGKLIDELAQSLNSKRSRILNGASLTMVQNKRLEMSWLKLVNEQTSM